MNLDHANLKARQREIRKGFSTALALRTHRALSWLNRADQELEDHDARFVFLWISFNAAYANEITDRREFSERRQLVNFMNRLVDSDREKLLYQMIWRRYSQPIRTHRQPPRLPAVLGPRQGPPVGRCALRH